MSEEAIAFYDKYVRNLGDIFKVGVANMPTEDFTPMLELIEHGIIKVEVGKIVDENGGKIADHYVISKIKKLP